MRYFERFDYSILRGITIYRRNISTIISRLQIKALVELDLETKRSLSLSLANRYYRYFLPSLNIFVIYYYRLILIIVLILYYITK